MISIYTITMGRELYLSRLINSIAKNAGNIEYEHHIGFQGIEPSDELKEKLKQHNCISHLWQTNCGAGEANNKIIPNLKGDIIVKLDDDALVVSEDYLVRVNEINNLLCGSAVFSPYPVGLINNPGGVASRSHTVKYSTTMDMYFTLRRVPHVGGFGRIVPRDIAKTFTWPNDLNNGTSGSEDSNFSAYCGSKSIPLFYLENSIVIEHQESTLGQHARYPEYFKGGRF
jgi:glycosyltransferase involved in cell wall biosynthesis